MKYVRRNVLCGLRARAGHGRGSEHQRVWEVANQRMHGTTHEPAIARREAERLPTKTIGGRPLYPHVGKELRQVAREAFVHWRGSCYSVPWAYAGKLVGGVPAGRPGPGAARHRLHRRLPARAAQILGCEGICRARWDALQPYSMATRKARAKLPYCSRSGHLCCNYNPLIVQHLDLFCILRNAA